MKNQIVKATKSLVQQADDLTKEHESFYEAHVVGGRKALYGLLQKIMALSESFDASPDKEHLIKFLRSELAEKHAIKTQENSSDISVLVRYITRADRKTTHVYAKAIEAAKQLNVKSEKFIEFVERAGGIEHLRSIGAVSDKSSTKAIANELAESNLWEFVRIRAQQPFATIKAIKGEFPGKAGSSYLHFFAAVQLPGRYEVITEVPVDEATELNLLDYLKQQVALALIDDPEAFAKLQRGIDDNKAHEAQAETCCEPS